MTIAIYKIRFILANVSSKIKVHHAVAEEWQQ